MRGGCLEFLNLGYTGDVGSEDPQLPLTRASSLPAVLSMAPVPVLLLVPLSEAEGPAGSGAGRPSVQSWGGAGQGGPMAPEVHSPTPPPDPTLAPTPT